MLSQLCSKIKTLKEKYKDPYLILGCNLNDNPNDSVDRIPEIFSQNSQFKISNYLCEKLEKIPAVSLIINY